jgi:hypothetical protein
VNAYSTLADMKTAMEEAREELFRPEWVLTVALRDREQARNDFHRKLDAYLLRQRTLNPKENR